MTTIAYDGRALAADRQSTYYNCILESSKIRRCGDFWFAACGSVEASALAREWLASGFDDSSRDCGEEGVHGLAVSTSDLDVFVVQGKRLVLWRCESPFFAIGSGGDYATAAMHLGKSAEESVGVASLFDPNTGVGVDVLCLATGVIGRSKTPSTPRAKPLRGSRRR